jgi:hypothetical protein
LQPPGVARPLAEQGQPAPVEGDDRHAVRRRQARQLPPELVEHLVALRGDGEALVDEDQDAAADPAVGRRDGSGGDRRRRRRALALDHLGEVVDRHRHPVDEEPEVGGRETADPLARTVGDDRLDVHHTHVDGVAEPRVGR